MLLETPPALRETPPRNVTCKRFFQLSHQSALLPVQVTVLVAVCVAAVAMLDADSSNPIWLNFLLQPVSLFV